MNMNLIIETILILFAILASNGIIYSLTFLNLNKNKNNKNFSENISVIRNSSEKDGLALTSLIASNPIRLTSSESSSSQTLSVTSSDTNVSQEIFDSKNWIDSEISEGIHTENSYLSSTNEEILPSNLDQFTSLDSITILDSQSYEQWREIAMDIHQHSISTPAGILQQIKFEELNILYSQDILYFGISQAELRIIIEHVPAMNLFNPEINHFILTMISYWHC